MSTVRVVKECRQLSGKFHYLDPRGMQTNPRAADPYDALDSGTDIKRNSRYETIKDEKNAEKDETRPQPHRMSRNRRSNKSSVLEEISHLKALRCQQ